MTYILRLGQLYVILEAGNKQLSPCLSGVSRPATNVYQLTVRWSPITLCFMLYPNLVTVEGVTHDVCSQTGPYWSTLPCPWLSNSAETVRSPPYKERSCMKFILIRQFLRSYSFEFFSPITVCKKIGAIYL